MSDSGKLPNGSDNIWKDGLKPKDLRESGWVMWEVIGIPVWIKDKYILTREPYGKIKILFNEGPDDDGSVIYEGSCETKEKLQMIEAEYLTKK